ncbi:DDB1- and CUL4-associated factor 17-like, partial [Physella acuta]|uniref:DDB1- and CUL4-associated factor 17-like n=1 Tax=Physella acuta TaxID=109671 RepID=UPI0027DD1895
HYAFFDNYVTCINCASPHGSPSKKFVVNKSRPAKFEDALLMEGNPESYSLPNSGHKSCLFALSSENFLFCIDLENGKIFEEVYIGSTTVKYKKILWNTVDESFTLCSQLNPKDGVLQSQEVVQLTVMSCLPLEICCKFSVTKQVFGHDVVDASIFLNILVVMHKSSYVRMYSLEKLVAENLTHPQKLFEKTDTDSRVGMYPTGISHTLQLSACPICLFEVRCWNGDVMLTMPPCYYLMCPYKEDKGYCCFSFETKQMIHGGHLEAEDDALNERVSLHADDTGRIIHMKNKELRVLKIVPIQESKERELVEDFVITVQEATKPQLPTITMSGRVVKPRKKENCVEIVDRSVLTMVYSEELDMMLVVSTVTKGDHLSTVLGFYDNWNGQMLSQFTLEPCTLEVLERSVCFYFDTVTHVIKRYDGRFECQVFKLQPKLDMADEWKGNKLCTKERNR